MPVCVSPQDREASKSNAVCWPFIAPCCGFIPSDAPSPLRTPEDSQTYEHISRSILPVSVRPVSGEDDPAWSPAPVQARKGERRGKNPFLFAMLFEKNIEIFSAPNPSVLCVFSICLPRFRAWTLGAGGVVGGYNAPGMPEITGTLTAQAGDDGVYEALFSSNRIASSGALAATGGKTFPIGSGTNADAGYGALEFRASRSSSVYGASQTVMPSSINLPIVLYMGIAA